MTQPKYKVTYVSNSCGNTDELSNQPHESVAQSLYDLLINHKEIKHPVIGVEGSWGGWKIPSNKYSSKNYKRRR